MSREFFGTDGIRGKVGEGFITADFVMRLGFAVGRSLKNQQAVKQSGSLRKPKAVIGKDTRLSGYLFEAALEAGFISAGCDVLMLGPMPTPGVAYLTKTFDADVGVVISASHNPYQDNGIKFFNAQGTKLSDEQELDIEHLVKEPMKMVASDELGKVRRIPDAAGRYIEFCKSTVAQHFSLRGTKIVVDCAHGATYDIAPSVFTELGAKVCAIGVKPNGYNINEKFGSTDVANLQKEVLEQQADLGIAFDGDGDRVIMVDKHGVEVDGDELAYVIARYQKTQGNCPGVVGTLMTNLGVEQALNKQGIEFARADVGDRYVKALMAKKKWQLGAESSGHIICGHVTTTGDGIVAALQVLQACYGLNESLESLCSELKKLPQKMINVTMYDKSAWLRDTIADAVERVEQTLGDAGRVLLRASGTEPVLRVLVEGNDVEQVNHLATALAQEIEPMLLS
ncbi:MAG: phosphoglucosamine mutase [Pseudomonadota bacterium]